MIAPTALALITTTFPQGPQRNRAFGVYAAMSGGGAAVGLVAGGLLTTYLSWRWVLFVNVPIGIVTALLARYVIGESDRQTRPVRPARCDHGDRGRRCARVRPVQRQHRPVGRLALGRPEGHHLAGRLGRPAGGFAFIESRGKHALLPMRMLQNRSRTGAYLVMLCLATAMFGIFFFLTIFVQEVLGYSALRSGLAFLPFAAMIVVISGVVSRLVARTGPRPLMIAGSAITAGGMYWFSHISVNSPYVSGLLFPMLVTSSGLGMLFVPLSLVALTKVRPDDAGVASSLLNTGQQVGGAIGLAALGTVTWTVVSSSIKTQMAAAAAAAARAGTPLPKPGAPVPASVLHVALAAGISRGFVVAAGISVLALIITILTITLRREDIAATPAVPGAAPPTRTSRSTPNSRTRSGRRAQLHSGGAGFGRRHRAVLAALVEHRTIYVDDRVGRDRRHARPRQQDAGQVERVGGGDPHGLTAARLLAHRLEHVDRLRMRVLLPAEPCHEPAAPDWSPEPPSAGTPTAGHASPQRGSPARPDP